MAYKDFRGNEADVSGWSDSQINRAHRTGRLIYVPDEPTAPVAEAAPAKTTKTTAKKTAAKKTTKK